MAAGPFAAANPVAKVPPMTLPSTGHRLRGDITFRTTVSRNWPARCPCESCRRATASLVTSVCGIANRQRYWTGKPPGTWRAFCPRCGSQMAHRTARCREPPESFAPTGHVHSDDRLPWVRRNDGLAQT